MTRIPVQCCGWWPDPIGVDVVDEGGPLNNFVNTADTGDWIPSDVDAADDFDLKPKRCIFFWDKGDFGPDIVHAVDEGDPDPDRLASTANITTGVQLHKAEVLSGLRNCLDKDRPNHYSISRLERRGVEKASGRPSTLRALERTVFNHKYTGTV